MGKVRQVEEGESLKLKGCSVAQEVTQVREKDSQFLPLPFSHFPHSSRYRLPVTLPYTGLNFSVMQCFLSPSKTRPHSLAGEGRKLAEKVKRERTGPRPETASREKDSEKSLQSTTAGFLHTDSFVSNSRR